MADLKDTLDSKMKKMVKDEHVFFIKSSLKSRGSKKYGSDSFYTVYFACKNEDDFNDFTDFMNNNVIHSRTFNTGSRFLCEEFCIRFLDSKCDKVKCESIYTFLVTGNEYVEYSSKRYWTMTNEFYNRSNVKDRAVKEVKKSLLKVVNTYNKMKKGLVPSSSGVFDIFSKLHPEKVEKLGKSLLIDIENAKVSVKMGSTPYIEILCNNLTGLDGKTNEANIQADILDGYEGNEHDIKTISDDKFTKISFRPGTGEVPATYFAKERVIGFNDSDYAGIYLYYHNWL